MKTLREYIDLVSEGTTGKYVGGTIGAVGGAALAARLKKPELVVPFGEKGWEVGGKLGDKGEELVRDKLSKKDMEVAEFAPAVAALGRAAVAGAASGAVQSMLSDEKELDESNNEDPIAKIDKLFREYK